MKKYKQLYQDFSNQNSLSMILPRAEFNSTTGKNEGMIMVSVSDSLGAITNVTKIVEIDPPSADFS